MIIRMYYRELGEHTHVRVFAGVSKGALGLCGTLAFRNSEWKLFVSQLRSKIEILPEE